MGAPFIEPPLEVKIMHVTIVNSLTYDDNKNHKDDDYQDNPQLHILPPQLTLEAGGCTLKHIGILVEVVC